MHQFAWYKKVTKWTFLTFQFKHNLAMGFVLQIPKDKVPLFCSFISHLDVVTVNVNWQKLLLRKRSGLSSKIRMRFNFTTYVMLVLVSVESTNLLNWLKNFTKPLIGEAEKGSRSFFVNFVKHWRRRFFSNFATKKFWQIVAECRLKWEGN